MAGSVCSVCQRLGLVEFLPVLALIALSLLRFQGTIAHPNPGCSSRSQRKGNSDAGERGGWLEHLSIRTVVSSSQARRNVSYPVLLYLQRGEISRLRASLQSVTLSTDTPSQPLQPLS